MARPNVPEGRFGAGRAAESGNRGCHSLGLEPAPGVFALPDVDGAEAFVRGAGDVQTGGITWWADYNLVFNEGDSATAALPFSAITGPVGLQCKPMRAKS